MKKFKKIRNNAVKSKKGRVQIREKGKKIDQIDGEEKRVKFCSENEEKKRKQESRKEEERQRYDQRLEENSVK